MKKLRMLFFLQVLLFWINKDDINNLEIIVPDDIAFQESIVNELNRYEERLNDARKKIASSSARKQAIMDKYLK